MIYLLLSTKDLLVLNNCLGIGSTMNNKANIAFTSISSLNVLVLPRRKRSSSHHKFEKIVVGGVSSCSTPPILLLAAGDPTRY